MSAYETEPILMVKLLVGLVEKRARPELESVLPPAAERNLLYAAVGM